MASESFHLEQYQEYLAHADKHVRIVETALDWFGQILERPNVDCLRVLDAGCGPGQLTSRLIRELRHMADKRPGRRVVVDWTCLDSSARALALCRAACSGLHSGQTQIGFVKTALEDYLFRPRSDRGRFDVVLCSHVLYHIADWPSCINGLISTLLPQGQLWIVLASRNAEVYRLFDMVSPHVTGRPDYAVRFSEELEAVLRGCGLSFGREYLVSRVAFDRDEVASFLSGRDVASICRTLGILWGYGEESVRTSSAVSVIQEYLRARVGSGGGQVEIGYRDAMFRVEGLDGQDF